MPAARLAGLLIMLAISLIVTIGSWYLVGFIWWGSVWGYAFLAITVFTWRRPLLGGSLAAGLTALLILTAFSAIIMNYESSAIMGLMLLAIALAFFGGAVAVLRSVKRISRRKADGLH